MNKFYDTLQDERGVVLPGYRVQVVTSAGDVVDIFSDRGGTRFTDAAGNVVNYATADSDGLAEFFYTAASGLIAQILKPNGDLYKTILGFSDNFILDNLQGTLPQASVDSLTVDLAAKVDATTLAGSSGAAMVGTVDGDVQTDLDGLSGEVGKASALSRQLAPKAYGLADTPAPGVVIQRLRTDYLDFAIYSAINAEGTKWARHFFSNRLLPGSAGAPVLRVATLALLYASTAVAAPAENHTTGTYATAPTAQQTPTDATDAGNWTSPATTGGVTTVSRPTAPGSGDTRTYSYSLAAGESKVFVLRGYINNTNGGIGKVTASVDGTEIDAADYLAYLEGGERILRYRGYGFAATGLIHIPVARLSNTSGSPQTVTFLIEEAASNPASGRVYDAGLNIYDVPSFNATGLHAFGKTNTSLGGKASFEQPNPGGTVVKAFTNATRVAYDYIAQTNGGKVRFTVYDSGGTEITDYLATELDTYSSTTQAKRKAVAEGLVKGTYYLHVLSIPEKNAASSDYRIYDAGGLGQDETTAGTLGGDPFDDQDISPSPGGTDLGTNVLFGPLNIEAAFELIPADETYTSSSRFVSGTHRNETSPTGFTVTVDGVDRTTDYNALAALGTIIGTKAVTVEFDTVIDTDILEDGTGAPGSPLADMHYKLTVDRFGFHPDITVAHTADGKMRINYVNMLQVIGPDAAAATGIFTRGVGGGFSLISSDSGPDFSLPANGDDDDDTRLASAFVAVNGDYTIVGTIDNLPELLTAFEPYAVSASTRRVYARNNGLLKAYLQPNGQGNTTAGFDVPSGFTWRMRKTTRAIPFGAADTLGISA